MAVVRFPKEKVYPRIVGAREMYEQQHPTNEMVWALCPYLRQHSDDWRCHHCPKYELTEYGEAQRGCYTMASEACRVVFAMLNRSPGFM